MRKLLQLGVWLLCPMVLAQVSTLGTVQTTGTTLICTSGPPSAATPTASPAAGTYSSTQSVTLSTATGGATIVYTTDGSTPTAVNGTPTHGTAYTTPISVSSSQTILAIASESGYTNSGLLTAAYVISSGAPTFSPAPGTYTTTQSVTLTCPAGKSAFYRTDGQTAETTIASTLYTGPISVAANTTISAICATLGAYQGQTQASSTAWVCHTLAGGSYTGPPSVTCSASGGVIGNPSNVIMSFPGGASPATLEITAPSGQSGQTQGLFPVLFGGNADPSAPTCDTCTEQVKDITFTVQGSGMANQEFDSPQFDFTHGINRQNGTQCQGSSGLIEVDSGNAGGWTQTTASCSGWTNGTTHEVINRVDHVNGDTGCGGNGCANYKYIIIDGTNTTLNGNYGGTQGYNTTSNKAWGWQFQPDLSPTGGSAVTAGWTVASANVALGFGDESSVASGTYTIAPVLATPTASPAAGTYATAQSVSLTLPGGSTGCYTTDGTTPTATTPGTCSHGTTYSSAISVPSSLTIKAIATESGFTNSAQLTAAYTITSGSTTLTVTPTSIAEGSILTNTTAYFQLVTVTNTGSANLTFSAIGFTGTNASDFAITSGFSPSVNPVGGNTYPLCQTTQSVAPGASCIVPVDFVPGANGSRSGSLQFTDNASGSPHTVAITGTGATATGTVLPACGSMLSASTTYYATSNITCNDAGWGLNGQNIVVNLNGHTITCGQSPSNTLTGRPCFYVGASYANPFNLSTCSLSGAGYQCYSGVTSTSNNGGSETIENGTINVAGGATSPATMQYGSAAIFSNEGGNSGSGQGWNVHDLTINIPLNCNSCWAYSSWPGDYGTGPGDKIWKVNVTDLSGFVANRCQYEGTAFNLAYYSSTSNPGAIAYENTVNYSPQDGFALATNQSVLFGNTLKVGNPSGTYAGTSATCSGVGTGANGTMSANGFAVEVTANNTAIVNNTINNYEGRGIDLSAPNGGLSNFYTSGNTITTTDLPNYVEYQGCQLGGGYGERQKFFGFTSATNVSSQNETITATGNQCPVVGFSQSDNSSNTNSDTNMTLTTTLASGHGNINAPAFQNSSNTDGNPAPYFSFNQNDTSDTDDVFFGDTNGSLGGVWTCLNCTFNKPATATTGWCGDPGSSVPQPHWNVFQACYGSSGSPVTVGPLYIVNPTFTGGAAESTNDFVTATTYMTPGSTGRYYIQYSYQVTVTGLVSGTPIVGATVTATDSSSNVECTATTNSSGIATCNGYTALGAANSYLNKSEYSFTAPSAPVTTTFNPYNFSISKAGCTTNTYSESITGPTNETKQLSGC